MKKNNTNASDKQPETGKTEPSREMKTHKIELNLPVFLPPFRPSNPSMASLAVQGGADVGAYAASAPDVPADSTRICFSAQRERQRFRRSYLCSGRQSVAAG